MSRFTKEIEGNQAHRPLDVICLAEFGEDPGRVLRAAVDGYEPSALPNGQLAGLPEDALDCACGLYLGDPTAWT